MKNKRKNRVLHIRRHILITRRIYVSNSTLTGYLYKPTVINGAFKNKTADIHIC
nr:MAG TPA: hypothetical protein [Caudoviricetes sp.]